MILSNSKAISPWLNHKLTPLTVANVTILVAPMLWV